MPTAEEIVEALKVCVDPEIQLDIVTLGLIYGVEIEGGSVRITMTLTTPACPYGQALIDKVRQVAEQVPGVKSVEINLVWDPPWQPSEELKAMLGIG